MFPILLIFALVALTITVIVYRVLPALAETRVHFSAEPDTAQPFGPDMAWIAIRTAEAEKIADVLELGERQAANWNAGIGTIYDPSLCDGYVFVSPPVKGWTFVAGVPLPLPVGRAFADKLTPLLARLSSEFREVQFFASYPAIDFFAWARLDRGRMVRAFAISDEGVVWDRGRLTVEERALGLKLFELRGIRGRRGDTGEAIILHPTQEQVLRMARGWSLDPSNLDTARAEAAAGFVARVPLAWRPERLRKAA